MESARAQLARPLPPLVQHRGTLPPSIHDDRVSLAYLGYWDSFMEEIMTLFRSTPLDHDVPIHNESEVYVGGSELGLTGRIIQNLCNPVMQALIPLPQMSSVRFGDIQSVIPASRVIPDVIFGLMSPDAPSSDSIYMVGEYKTFWTMTP